MIVEWEYILDCNFKCEYCVNGRNSALEKPIKYEKNKDKVFNFISNLNAKYPDEELFLFGGEPFLHPFIDEIIKYLNLIEMKFIIQTNASRINTIKNIKEHFEIQVSIHPTQIKNKELFIKEIIEIKDKIRRLDIMYVGSESLEFAKLLLPEFKDKVVIKPIADFSKTNFANNHLFRFNEIKKTVVGKVYKFEEGQRSFLWEDQMKGVLTFKNKPCIYKDSYILFDPMLNSYNCSHRQNNDICPNDYCFLM